MAFKVLTLAHAPDADKARHRSQIDTGMLQLSTVIVRDQAEAVAICQAFMEREGIDSVLVCPGFTHEDVAGIVEATGGRAGVFVARGDGPGARISAAALQRAGYRSAQNED